MTKRRTRTKKPIFVDEPIQWHLSTSAHDKCPACGSHRMGWLGRRHRVCLDGCGLSTKLGGDPKDWFEQKMENYPLEALRFPIDQLVHQTTENDLRLEEAQGDSLDGKAWLPTSTIFGVVTWKKGDASPVEAEKGKPKIFALPGSTLWYALRYHPVWMPNKPMTILDRIVDAISPEMVITV